MFRFCFCFSRPWHTSEFASVPVRGISSGLVIWAQPGSLFIFLGGEGVGGSHLAAAQNMYQHGTLANGTKDQNLRNSSSFDFEPYLFIRATASQVLTDGFRRLLRIMCIASILWMDEILHHFQTMGNHCLLVFTGESPFQGFLGGAGFRPSTEWNRFDRTHASPRRLLSRARDRFISPAKGPFNSSPFGFPVKKQRVTLLVGGVKPFLRLYFNSRYTAVFFGITHVRFLTKQVSERLVIPRKGLPRFHPARSCEFAHFELIFSGFL